jgi:glutamine amidotransferase
MGWNSLQPVVPIGENPLFSSDLAGSYVYFVHSYYVEEGRYTTAQTNYIHPFSAGLQMDNFYATQFHPEKSGEVGEQILRNFLNL